jgi:hypothetical protein
MPIAITCPSCGQHAQVPGSAAGKTARCPRCQYSIPVPVPAARPAPDDQDDLEPDSRGRGGPRWRPPRRPDPPERRGATRTALQVLWALYAAAAVICGLSGLAAIENPHNSAVQQAAAAAMYAFYQITGYCVVRALDKAMR